MDEDVEIATLTIIHHMADEDTYVTVDLPDEMGLVEAFGILEMAKVWLLKDDDDGDA